MIGRKKNVNLNLIFFYHHFRHVIDDEIDQLETFRLDFKIHIMIRRQTKASSISMMYVKESRENHKWRNSMKTIHK